MGSAMSTMAPAAIPMMTPMGHSNAEVAVGWLGADVCVCDMINNSLAAVQCMLDIKADGESGVTKVKED